MLASFKFIFYLASFIVIVNGVLETRRDATSYDRTVVWRITQVFSGSVRPSCYCYHHDDDDDDKTENIL